MIGLLFLYGYATLWSMSLKRPYRKQLEFCAMILAVTFFVWQGVHSNKDRERVGYGKTDFGVFVATGATILHSSGLKPSHIYTKTLFKPVVQRIRHVHGGTQFLYPPQAAVLFAPFAVLPFTTAASLFLWLNAFVFIVTYYTVIRWGIGDRVQRIRYSALLVILAWSEPLSKVFKSGQLNVIVGALLVGGCIAIAYKRQYISGVALAIATAIKVFPVLFVPYLIIKKQWSALGAYVATSLALWLATLPFFGVDGLYRFWQYPFSWLMNGRLNYIGKSISLYGTFRNMQYDFIDALQVSKHSLIVYGGYIFTVLTLCALVGLWYILWKRRTNTEPKGLLIEYTLIICFFLLFSKYIHTQYLVWLVPAILYCLAEPWKHTHERRMIGVGILVLFFTQFYTVLAPLHTILQHRLHTVGVIVLTIGFVVHLVRLSKHHTLA